MLRELISLVCIVVFVSFITIIGVLFLSAAHQYLCMRNADIKTVKLRNDMFAQMWRGIKYIFAPVIDIDCRFMLHTKNDLTFCAFVADKSKNFVQVKAYPVQSGGNRFHYEMKTDDWHVSRSPEYPALSKIGDNWHRIINTDFYVAGDLEQFEEDVIKIAMVYHA